MEQSRGNATWCVPAGRWSSSYRAEQVAFLAAVEDAVKAPKEVKTRLCTDSFSLVTFLKKGAGGPAQESLTKIWTGLSNLSRQKKNVQIAWIPGHADIAGNEQADQAANTGRALPQETARIDLPSAKVAIRGVCWKKWSGTYHTTVPPEHTHRRATDGRCLKYESEWSRRDQVLLHQLRADRCPLLQATLARWNRPDTDGLCPECGVPEDTDHVVCDCPKYQAARSALLGHTLTLTVLQSDPDAVLKFMRRTGLLQGPILQRWGRPHFWSGDVRRPHFSGPMGTEVGGACLQVAPPAGGPQQHQPEWDRVVTKAPWRCEP